MNRLMRQAFEPGQIRGRESRIRVDRNKQKIAYKAPNGMIFFIDTQYVEAGGEPIVSTPEAEICGASHKTHTYGGGRVCLASTIRDWELTQILFQCDSWARGYEIYQRTGEFPKDPRQSFCTRARQKAKGCSNSLLRFLFG
ncbi:hypothetical protein JXL19_11945 [bacterium]|nr:hypothetical protein [bacterium]